MIPEKDTLLKIVGAATLLAVLAAIVVWFVQRDN